MENFYDSYTKVIDDKTHYFVKRYLRFTEFENVADVLEGYGMHTDFTKACNIAGIKDPLLIKKIFSDMENNTAYAKVISLGKTVFEGKSAAL